MAYIDRLILAHAKMISVGNTFTAEILAALILKEYDRLENK